MHESEPRDAAASTGAVGGGRALVGGGVARKQVLLRLDPAVHAALTRWAEDELRSVNAQIELVVRRALADVGRAPADAMPQRRRGRPRNGG